MPQTHNNEDIRSGFLHDFETRVWVNCNWILDYVENDMTCNESGEGCDCNYKDKVGIFNELGNFAQERFWKDFNYELRNDERFRLPNYYEGDCEPSDSTLEAIREIWTNLIIELEEDEHMDNCWNKAKVKYVDELLENKK